MCKEEIGNMTQPKEMLGEFELNKIYCMDCLEGLKKIPNDSIDLIVTDPPFFMKLDHFKTRKRFQQTFSDVNIIEYFFSDVLNECKRILRKGGRIYCFCDGQSYPLFWYLMFQFCKSVRPLIWDKKTSINGYSWRHQHELIIFAEMPEAKPVPSGDGDILRFNAVKVDIRQHPAEKPLELISEFIKKSSNKESIVLDFFMGSGTTAVACKQLGRRFIGFEISPEYCEIANKRLEQETLL